MVTLSIVENKEFFALYDELIDDNYLQLNRTQLLEGMIDGNLMTLTGYEEDYTDYVIDRNDILHFILPCFIIVENESIKMIWVSSRIRKRGFGTLLVELSGAKTYTPQCNSCIGFWETTNLISDDKLKIQKLAKKFVVLYYKAKANEALTDIFDRVKYFPGNSGYLNAKSNFESEILKCL